jgi:hypothetical protein
VKNRQGRNFHMKMFWQIGRAALARALRKIVLPAVSPALPTQRNEGRTAIGRMALAVGAILLLSVGAVQAARVATTTTLTSSPNPSTSGQSVTFTSTVAPQSGPEARAAPSPFWVATLR